jgi:hypothetical protein
MALNFFQISFRNIPVGGVGEDVEKKEPLYTAGGNVN